MFEYEKYEHLLNNPEAAREYCLSIPDDWVAQAELIMLDIIFFHQETFLTNYHSLQKYLNVFKRTGNKRGYIRVVSNLTFYSLDLQDFLNTRKYAQETLKYLPDYNEAKVALAFANIKLNKEMDDSFEFLKLQCNNDDLSEEIRNTCFAGIGEYFSKKSLYDEGYKFFEKSLIYSSNKAILRREMLDMALGQKLNVEIIKEAYNAYVEYIDEEENKAIIFYIADRYLNERLFAEASEYLDKLNSFELNQKELDTIHIFNARHKGMNRDFKGAMKEILEISENEFDTNPYVSYLAATTIFLNDDRREFEKGIEYLSKSYSILPNDENLANLINGYLINDQFNEAEQLMKTHKIDKKNPIYIYYKGVIYMKNGNWNKAEQYLFNYMYKIKTRIPEYVFVASRNTPVKKAIFNDYAIGKSLNDIRQQANMHLHGFGIASIPNINLAISLLEDKQEDPKFDNCCLSLLGNAYLKNNEIEKALAVFKKGHERYVNYEDNCTCSTGFYCYCLANGIGKDSKEEAFVILDSLKPSTMSNVCVFTYVELCIKNNMNLEKAWMLLENLNEWRYNAGKYYMMAKLAPLVGKKSNKYITKFKKCLKHIPISEKLHYMDDQNTFYLTNI